MWKFVASIDHGCIIVSVSSVLIMLVFQPLAKDAIAVTTRIRASVSRALATRLDGDDERLAAAPPQKERHCERCADAAAAMGSLGLREGDDVGGGVYCEAVEELMESKVAGEGELRSAFGVFDVDGDGFVCAAELERVLRRLGMGEGAGHDECARMIAAHDGDGDGRVSFQEFRAMMENAA